MLQRRLPGSVLNAVLLPSLGLSPDYLPHQAADAASTAQWTNAQILALLLVNPATSLSELLQECPKLARKGEPLLLSCPWPYS